MTLFSAWYVDTLSVDPRLDPGTDFEGNLSEFAMPCCAWISSIGGEVSCEPDRLLRLLNPAGDTRLEDEYRFRRE